MEDSLYDRVRQRAEARERLAAQRAAEEMAWSKGSVLAISDCDEGFRLVRCEDDITSADVTSDSTFHGAVYAQGAKSLKWIVTDSIIVVSPSQVLRPVKFTSEGLMPQEIFDALMQSNPPVGVLDSSEASDREALRVRSSQRRSVNRDEKDSDAEPPASDDDDEDDDEGGSPKPVKQQPKKRERKAASSPKPRAGKAVDDEDGDEDDEGTHSTPKKPKGKKSAASPSPPRQKKAASPKKEASPKPPKAAKPPTKKRRLEEEFPFVERNPALFGAATALNPNSHKEAMRAVLTCNVDLFKTVLQSEGHKAWLSASLVQSFDTWDDAGALTPLEAAFADWKFPIIQAILESNQFPKASLLTITPDNMFQQPFPVETKFISIFDDFLYATNSARIAKFGTGVAAVNGSLLQGQGSGQANFRMLGRHVRNVAAGRGGRELGNAFLGGPRQRPIDGWFSLFTDAVQSGRLTKEMFSEFSQAAVKILGDGNVAQEARVLGSLEQFMKSNVAHLVQNGHAVWALEILKRIVTADTSNVTGQFHIAALDPATTALPESKQMRASLLKKGFSDATPLHYACVNPNVNVLKMVLNQLSDIPSGTCMDNSSHGVWHYAVMNPSPDAVRALLDHGVSVESTPISTNPSPFHLAAEFDRHEHLALLLKDNAEQRLTVLHMENRQQGQTPWLSAAVHGSANAMRVMLDSVSPIASKALLKQVRKGTGLTALHIAAAHGHLNVVRLLVERGAQIDCKDKHKRTPLLIAVKQGHLEIVSFLASKGSKLFAADSSGNQAVHYAAAFGHFEILEYLVNRCHSATEINTLINAETAWKMTPIGLALLSGFSSTCGAYLLSLTSKPAALGEDESAQQTAQISIDINFRDSKYDTLLHRLVREATMLNMPQVASNVAFLLSIGADPLLPDPKGETILHLLASSDASRNQRRLLSYYLALLRQKRDQIISLSQQVQHTGLQDFASAILGAGAVSQQLPSAAAPVPEPEEDDDDNDDDDDEEDEDDEDEDEETSSVPKRKLKAFSARALPAFGGKGFGKGAAKGAGNVYQQSQQYIAVPQEISNYQWVIQQRINCNPTENNTTSSWYFSLNNEITAVDAELSREDCDLKMCKTLITNHKCDPNVTNEAQATPLLLALRSSHTQFVEKLVECGASLTIMDAEGNNVLHHLFGSQNLGPEALTMVREKIAKVADLSTMSTQLNRDGLSPLHVLLANAVQKSNQSQQQPVVAAFVTDMLACLEAMIAAPKPPLMSVVVGPRQIPKPDAPPSSNNTSGMEHAAPEYGAFGGLRSRPAMRAKPAAIGEITNQNPNPTPPVFQCVSPPSFLKKDTLGPEFVIDMKTQPPLPLLPQNAYFYCGGWTLLHFAATLQLRSYTSFDSSPYTKLLEWILRKTPEAADAVDVFGRTPLMLAVLRGDLTVVNFILSNTPEGSGRKADANGVSPIMIACQLPSFDIFNALLSRGEHVEALSAHDNWGRTVLHRIAAARNMDALVATLPRLGQRMEAAVNAQDRDGVRPLHVALASGNTSSFIILDFEIALMDAGADPDAVDKFNRNVLHHCFLDITGSLRGDPIEALGTLLTRIKNKQALMDGKETRICGYTPVHQAIVCKSLSSCLLLAGRGSRLDITDDEENTPLALALKNGAVDLAITLLQLGKARVNPDVFVYIVTWVNNATDPSLPKIKHVTRETACRFAMTRQWNSVVYMLMEAGYSRRQAVMDALAANLAPLVDALLNKIPQTEWSATLSGIDAGGRTILHWLCALRPSAAANEWALFIKLFRAFVDVVKVSPRQADHQGDTAAHCANANVSVLELLKTAGADVNAKNNAGLSPASSFFERPGIKNDFERAAFIKAMQLLGASPDFLVARPQSNVKITALTACLIDDDLKTLVALIELGANLSHTDSSGLTLLSHAVIFGKVEAAIILLRSGRNVGINQQDNDGNTALHHAVLKNNTTLTQQLLSTAGISINIANAQLRTPLHIVVQPFAYGSFDNGEILAELLKAGASSTNRDKFGFTAMDYTSSMLSPVFKTVFAQFGIEVPNLSRNSSVITTSKWADAHTIVDPEADAAEFFKANSSSVQATAAISSLVDNVYFKSVKGATTATVQVWEQLDATLTKVDVSYGPWGMNMFYRLQLLHDVFQHVWILWTRWGRIGDDGQYQATPFPSLEQAVKEFKTIFKSKTSNEWEHRNEFVKIKGKYLFHQPKPKSLPTDSVLIPFTESDFSKHPTKLNDKLTSTLKELCDVTTLSQAYKLTGIEASYWPLGKISRDVLDAALGILGQIKTAIEQREALTHNRNVGLSQPLTGQQILAEQQTLCDRIADLANMFYEMVPHVDFANDRIAPPRSAEDLKVLWDRVVSMKELQLSAKLLLGARNALSHGNNPLDYLLAALDIDVHLLPTVGSQVQQDVILPAEGAEYLALSSYVKRSCTQRIHSIFRVQRKGEAENFSMYCDGMTPPISNRRLLFHGSSTSNVLPILKEGLRIAPPEAPAHGYMFGKGVYFADMASKSMNYAHRESQSAFLFVCEVALGNEHHRVNAQYIETLPAGCQSTKALGKMCPSANEDVTMANGLIVPLGEVCAADYGAREFARMSLPENSQLCLASNEYIVYNTAQIRIRYVIQFKEIEQKKL